MITTVYINKAHIYGNLTRDPELKALPSGGQVCTFSVATNRTYKKADGTKAEETEFHNIVVFGKTAESCAQYLRKASSVYVEGRLRTRSWEKEGGGKQYRTEIMADNVQFGPRATRDVADDVDQRAPAERPRTGQPAPKSGGSDTTFEYPQEDINPDDIPF